MAVRPRTDDFLQLRGFAQPKSAKDTATLIPMVELPRWIGVMDTVRKLEKGIDNTIEELESLHRQHLKVQFGVARDEAKEERDIERTQAEINRRFKECELLIVELDKVYRDELGDDGGTDAELTVLRNVKMCLANELSKLQKGFNQKQHKYVKDLRKQKDVRNKWANNSKDVQERMQLDGLQDEYIHKGLTQDQIDMIMLQQRNVDDQEKEIRDILNSIRTIHEMFKDLNQLVIEQGTVLDRIESNMNLTHDRVKKATKELVQAAKYQEAGKFKLCVLLLIVLIIGFTIAVIIKMSS